VKGVIKKTCRAYRGNILSVSIYQNYITQLDCKFLRFKPSYKEWSGELQTRENLIGEIDLTRFIPTINGRCLIECEIGSNNGLNTYSIIGLGKIEIDGETP